MHVVHLGRSHCWRFEAVVDDGSVEIVATERVKPIDAQRVTVVTLRGAAADSSKPATWAMWAATHQPLSVVGEAVARDLRTRLGLGGVSVGTMAVYINGLAAGRNTEGDRE